MNAKRTQKSTAEPCQLFDPREVERVQKLGPRKPGAIVPVISDRLDAVSPAAKRVHDYLARRAYQSEPVRGLVCVERLDVIARHFGIWRPMLSRYLLELEKAGHLLKVAKANRRDFAVYWLPLVVSGQALLMAAHLYAKGE